MHVCIIGNQPQQRRPEPICIFSNYRKGECVDFGWGGKETFTEEIKLNTKHALSGAVRKDAAITQLYGKIGIPAVAAAARYQAEDRKT